MLVAMHDEPAVRTSEPAEAEENVGHKIITGGSWRVLAFAFAALLGVVMTAIVSREIGPLDFALFTTAMSLVTIALSLSDVGLITLGVREYAARAADERVAVQQALIGLRLITAVLTSVGIVAFAILKDYPTDLVWGLVAAGIGICALSLAISYSVPLQATFRLGQVAALEAGRQTVQMLLMIASAIIFANVGWLMAVFLPTGIIVAVAAAYMTRGIAPLTPRFDFGLMRSLLALAGIYAFTAAVGANYPYVAQVVSNSVLDAHDSGMFSLAFRVFVVGVAAFATAAGGAFALLARAGSEDDRERLAFATHRLAEAALLAGVGSAAAMVTGAPLIVAALGGSEFADAVPVVMVIGLCYPATNLALVAALNLLADQQYRALIVRVSIGAMASLTLVYLLSEAYGAVGAAAGLLAGEIVLVAGYVTRVARVDRTALPRLRWILTVFVAGALACIPAAISLPALVAPALAGVIYLGLVLAMRLIPPELLHPIKNRLGLAS